MRLRPTLAAGSVALLLALAAFAATGGRRAMAGQGAGQGVTKVGMPSSQQSSVTVYGASWCGACKVLERGLRERDIPFDEIDVDRNPDAHARAKAATGTSAIPVTNVVRSGDGTWIVGADVAAVERAYRGN